MKSIAGFLCMLLLGFGNFRAVTNAFADHSQEERAALIEEATPIRPGEMTAIQKAHAKLFKQYRTDRRLDTIFPNDPASENEMQAFVGPPLEVLSAENTDQSLEQFFAALSCEADAILIVRPARKASQLTENREFIFMDYTVQVDEILKNNPSASVDISSPLLVTRPRGKVSIEGRKISTLDSSFLPLKINEQHLLFLKYVPETGAYQSIRKGSYLVQDRRLFKLTDEQVPGWIGESMAFTRSLRSALNQECT